MEQIKRFFKEESGTQVVETALVLGLISVVAIAMLTALGTAVVRQYTRVEAALPD
jgi:Flp pilus assembly pilin Flp